jgi:hypothetical protein
MEGAALAAERQFDRDIALAWHVGAFSGMASVGKLKALSQYRRKTGQSPDQMLDTLRMLNEAGAPMSFKQVN